MEVVPVADRIEIQLSGNFKAFPGKVLRARTEFQNCIEKAMRGAVETGVREGRQNIETRGTGKVWSRPWGPNGRTASIPGRVDTGEMRDQFKGSVSVEKSSVVGEVGWTGSKEDYFLYQEEGFNHWITQKWIEGMRALADAKDVAFDLLVEECENCMERLMKGLL